MSRAGIGGVLRDLRWTYKDAQVEAGDGRKLTVRFACAEPALELRSVWHARKGPGPVRHAMFVTNRSGKPVTLTFQPSVDLAIVPPVGGPDALHAWYVKDEGAGGRTMPRRSPALCARPCRPAMPRMSRPCPGSDWVPIVILDSGGARGVYAAIEWSHCRLKVTGRGAAAGAGLRSRRRHARELYRRSPRRLRFRNAAGPDRRHTRATWTMPATACGSTCSTIPCRRNSARIPPIQSWSGMRSRPRASRTSRRPTRPPGSRSR